MAYLFDDANSQRLVVGNNAFSAVPYSMACWVYLDSLAAEQGIVGVGDSGADTYTGLNVTTAGHVRAVSREAGVQADALSSGAGLSINTWAHVAGVWTTTTDRVAYRDGANAVQETTAVTLTNLNQTVVGTLARAGLGNYVSGRLADVAIWNDALTAGEIAALAQGYDPRLMRAANLIAYYPLTRAAVSGTSHLDRWRNQLGSAVEGGTGAPSLADPPRLITAA